MSDIFSLLKQQESVIETGIIDSVLESNFYRVLIGRRFVRMKSVIGTKLHPGQRVIINKIKNNLYIVGAADSFSKKTKKEIIISG